MKKNSGLDYRFESKLLHFDSIPARREIGHVVFSRSVGEALIVNTGTGIHDRDGRRSDDRLVGIGNAAGEGSERRLCAELGPARQKTEEDQTRAAHEALDELGYTLFAMVLVRTARDAGPIPAACSLDRYVIPKEGVPTQLKSFSDPQGKSFYSGKRFTS